MVEPSQWIGRQRVASDVIDAWHVAAFNAALDRTAELPTDGTPLPPCWQWLFFRPLYPASHSGPDGHERLGAFLPDVPVQQRMWAGSRMEITRPLQVGERATRTSTIRHVREKQGRSGTLVFVTVAHDYEGDRGGALQEEQDIVYREQRPGAAAAGPDSAEPLPEPAWRATWHPDPALLFRYSALTYNSHRIHYDYRYCTEQENYPGLVVHGPLMATLMVDLAVQARHERINRFAYRSLRPVFDHMAFETAGVPESDGIRLWVTRPDGAVALSGTAS